MSHFAVMVIGNEIEKQLAPFQENNMGDCPKEYLQFNETETEYIQKYEEESVEMIQSPTGERYYLWDNRFKVGTFPNETKVIPADHITVSVAHKDRYATFEEFMQDWAGSEKRDPETGKYGYWENPNKKWDWYTIGGRWTGFFRMKSGAAGEVGRPGLMTPVAKQGTADAALKRDIDFDGMRSEAGEEAAERFDKVFALIAPHINTFIPWDRMRDEVHPGDIKAAREAYHAQDAQKSLQKGEDRDLRWSNVEEFLCSREDYIQRARDAASCPFAVLKDGQWYERGSMGWWGMVADEKDKSAWAKEFAALMDSLPDDTMLTIVDCHI